MNRKSEAETFYGFHKHLNRASVFQGELAYLLNLLTSFKVFEKVTCDLSRRFIVRNELSSQLIRASTKVIEMIICYVSTIKCVLRRGVFLKKTLQQIF